MRISKKNYKVLVRIKGYLEAKDGETYSIDDALSDVLKHVSTYSMAIGMPSDSD